MIRRNRFLWLKMFTQKYPDCYTYGKYWQTKKKNFFGWTPGNAYLENTAPRRIRYFLETNLIKPNNKILRVINIVCKDVRDAENSISTSMTSKKGACQWVFTSTFQAVSNIRSHSFVRVKEAQHTFFLVFVFHSCLGGGTLYVWVSCRLRMIRSDSNFPFPSFFC